MITTNTEPTHAVLYIRVSKEEQVKEGFSIPAQKNRLQAFCTSQGWVIEETYIDEGVSAKDMNRPELQRLLQDIKTKRIQADVLLVWRLDRLTRSVIDLYTILSFLEEHESAFRSSTEVYDTTTAIGRLFLNLVAALAQWERENLAERVWMGMEQMAKEGLRPGTTQPYGYNYVDGELVVNASEAAIIKQMYEMYTRGTGVRGLVRWLNGSGIPSKTGKAWSDNTVAYILRNPLYIGKFVWGWLPKGKGKNHRDMPPAELTYLGSHEPILPEDLWNTVQAINGRRKELPPRHATGNYPLTGILTCGLCGKPMNGTTSTQRSLKRGVVKKRWYKCSARDHQGVCAMCYLAADWLEDQVVNHVKNAGTVCDEATLREIAAAHVEDLSAENTAEEISRLKAELTEIRTKKSRWYDAYEDGELSREDIRERLAPLSARETGIRAKIEELEKSMATTSLDMEEIIRRLQDFSWHWSNANPQERKELALAFFENIKVFPDKTFTVKIRP